MQYHTMLCMRYAIAYDYYLTCDVIVTMLYAHDVMNEGIYMLVIGLCYRLYIYGLANNRLFGLTDNMPRGILYTHYHTTTANHHILHT